MSSEFLGVPNPRKKTAIILKAIRLDHETSFNVGPNKTHKFTSLGQFAPSHAAGQYLLRRSPAIK
jgi:hypothetical protein